MQGNTVWPDEIKSSCSIWTPVVIEYLQPITNLKNDLLMGYAVLHLSKARGSDSGISSHIEQRIKPKNTDTTDAVLDGIVSLFDDSKTKRTQREAVAVTRENDDLKNQVRGLHATIDTLKRDFNKVKQELHRQIEHLYDLMPELKELLYVERTCEALRFDAELTKRIVRGESVGFKGSLYSPEHNATVQTDHSTAKTEHDPHAGGRLRLSIDGEDAFGWLRRKYDEQYPHAAELQREQMRRGRKL